MKILFTGKTDFKYNRVRVLLAGLKQLKDIEIEVFPIKSRKDFNKTAFLKAQEDADFIYIPPFRHRDVGFIKKLTNKPIVFDPLVSKYLTKVVDYGHFWKAPSKYFIDKIPFNKCDLLIADTQAHKQYFIKKFNINADKIGVVPVGVDTELFYPTKATPNQNQVFKVGCYGTFVPLQGMSTIIHAAKLLKEEKQIEIHIIGSGYEYKKVKSLVEKYKLDNVKLLGWVDYEKLNPMMNEFDVCLGVFGNSVKADAVIPNKVFHFAALGKCVISKDTQAIREVFTPSKNIVLCQNTPEQIATHIMELKNDTTLRTSVGQNAKQLITSSFNQIHIAQLFVDILKNYALNKKNLQSKG